ncbi:PREDICTED: uncharacterized protein LOC105562008 isoform X2 [Vollenhovia emeryi]|uniref:uncharacterized protein LOC105562008 isoform X2 n=1 Tax=Vollenhovia emeryi TaxID=411798 RepID=UPI0005F3C4F4|nr:PREDICTED: uncharacterized protein LOC105562008 isoform X2 [Vollenhovia emeryi]
MWGLSSFAVFFAVVLGTAVSKPLWSTLVGTNYLYPTPGIGAQPQYLAAYQNAHSPYYVYNVYSNAGGVPSTLHVSGKPEISHNPVYSFYYGTPIYDIRIPLNPVYPVLTPSHPGIPPALPPTSTEQSFDEADYDGIEKLDTKFESDTEIKKPEDNEQDDSITVEAI